MTTDVRFSPMTVDDFEPVYALWRATPGMGLSGSDTREWLGRYLARNPGMSFVARLGDDIVGAVVSGHDGHRGYLHHLAVDPRCRGVGVGAELVRRCLESLRAAGMQRTHLFVHADNDLGLGFWRHGGWRRRDDIVMFTHGYDASGPAR
jgi:ribosomal protein S18 acetylase RimI-like enzyme